MKVAILFAGPYRGNENNKNAHLQHIGNYDTYVSCYEHYIQNWIDSGWPIKKIFITPKIKFEDTNWYKYRNDSAGQSGFWQFWNLKNVINSIEEDYDWYIKSRTDLVFTQSDLVEHFFTTLEPNTLYCPEFHFNGRDWGEDLLNDQFYIGDANTMNVISKFVTKYYNSNRHGVNDSMASNERNLRIYLKENNINVKKIYKLPYTKNHNGYDNVTGESGRYQFELF
jgi:hypothetical protein